MPELAEVEFFRKRWHQAAVGRRVTDVLVHPQAKVFRGTDPDALVRTLHGSRFVSSATAAKQMLFRFSGGAWLGLHLGMSGDLYVREPGYTPSRHDHLVLKTAHHALVFTDPRMFGRVQFHRGPQPPAWWTRIAPPILSRDFNAEAVADFLRRRSRAPTKAVLLMQERFPGIGNWMADEILWRAAIHPRQPAGSLSAAEIKTLWRECRHVCRLALTAIAGRGEGLPRDLNINIPKSWLFRHRWQNGGRDPLTDTPLVREEIGGRTTCWSPARQRLKVGRTSVRPRAAAPHPHATAGAALRRALTKPSRHKAAPTASRNRARPPHRASAVA